MADTVTITFDQRTTRAQQLGNSPFGIISGTIDITSYSQTKAAYSAITGLFKTLDRCVVDGVASGGDLTRWDPATSTVRAYSAIGTEAANAANVGTVGFIAIGQLG